MGKASSNEKPAVLSWLAQSEWREEKRQRGSFEVLVRHIFVRLLSGLSAVDGTDETGDVTPGNAIRAAYAAALPLLVYALFLFPVYHQPAGKPSFWVQVSHHFFYVDFSFAVMGLVTVLHWELLFPDMLDALILTHLPMPKGRLLRARVVALLLFFGGVLVETSALGMLFFPAVADLPHMLVRHFAVHAAAVLAAGLCAVLCVLASKGVLVCCLSHRMAQVISPLVQAFCLLCFTMLLALESEISHLLPHLLANGSSVWRWFPPFWFLGLYEDLLVGKVAPSCFHQLAHLGLAFSPAVLLLAAATYPLAHARKTRQAIQGSATERLMGSKMIAGKGPLESLILPDSRSRAVFHLISQTVWRIERTRLLVVLFAALALAAPTGAWMMRLAGGASGNDASLLQIIRLAVPAAAFFAVAGLRIAFRAPVGRAGVWAFRVIGGLAKTSEKAGAEAWVIACSCCVTSVSALVVYPAAPATFRYPGVLLEQLLLGVVLSVLLTDAFFCREWAVPFTESHAASVDHFAASAAVVFVIFPVLAFALVRAEPWLEATRIHLFCFLSTAFLMDVVLRSRKKVLRRRRSNDSDMEEDVLLPGEIGLRS